MAARHLLQSCIDNSDKARRSPQVPDINMTPTADPAVPLMLNKERLNALTELLSTSLKMLGIIHMGACLWYGLLQDAVQHEEAAPAALRCRCNLSPQSHPLASKPSADQVAASRVLPL